MTASCPLIWRFPPGFPGPPWRMRKELFTGPPAGGALPDGAACPGKELTLYSDNAAAGGLRVLGSLGHPSPPWDHWPVGSREAVRGSLPPQPQALCHTWWLGHCLQAALPVVTAHRALFLAAGLWLYPCLGSVCVGDTLCRYLTGFCLLLPARGRSLRVVPALLPSCWPCSGNRVQRLRPF